MASSKDRNKANAPGVESKRKRGKQGQTRKKFFR